MLFSFEGTAFKRKYGKSGDNSREDTPVPIPNTEVKLSSAEDTWREAAWEIRTSPVFHGPMVKWLRHHPFTVVTRVRVPVGSPISPLLKRGIFLKICYLSATGGIGRRTRFRF